MLLNCEVRVVDVVVDCSHVSPIRALEVLIQNVVLDQPFESLHHVFNVNFNFVWLVVYVFSNYLPYVDVIAVTWELVPNGLDLQGCVHVNDTPMAGTSRLLAVRVVKAVVNRHDDRRSCNNLPFDRVESL